MNNLDYRVEQLEERLNRIEAALTQIRNPMRPSTVPTPAPQTSTKPPTTKNWDRLQTQKQIPQANKIAWSATNILGWGGATALVFAAVYMIRLSIESGWLTPSRQVLFTVLAALGLISAGMGLRQSKREYASLLPAAGVVMLFLSIYGAHLYYHLIGTTLAAGAIILVCLTSLWLCLTFNSQLYAFFAVVGSYSAPFLLSTLSQDLTDLVLYYSAWGVVFCGYAIWVGNRQVYLLALYMGIIGFDLIRRIAGSDDWAAAVIFQLIQFFIFVSCAVLYSIKHKAPMSQEIAIAHAPALLVFYCLEYALLIKHLPNYAPWIAVASAGVLGLSYGLARLYLKESLEGARWILSAYAGVVLLHAGYLESVPDQWGPWVALSIVLAAAVYGLWRKNFRALGWPMGIVIGLIFVGNYIRVVLDINIKAVPLHDFLVIVYAVLLYGGYYAVRHVVTLSELRIPLIYAGHIGAMSAALHILNEHFAVSLTWGILGLACIWLALKQKDKTLGQSSLLVFAVSAAKALLYDLSGAAPVTRILCLLVLGATFYLGGWLYNKVNELEPIA